MKTPHKQTIVSVALFALLLPAAACQGATQPTNKEKAMAKPATPEKAPPAATAVTPPRPDAPPAPVDVAAPPSDAAKTTTGLAYKVLEKGSGTRKPTSTSTVEVHYTGWTTDGKMFDSSVTRGQPASFPLNQVIKGWTEGLQFMVEGDKTRFWIPAELAYGNTPSRPGAPVGMLVFDVELLSIQ